MSAKAIPRTRPSVITALELIGLDESSMPEGRFRSAVTMLDDLFGAPKPVKVAYERHASLVGRYWYDIAPIKPEGTPLFKAINSVLHLQAILMSFGVLVRGGVTIGDAAVRQRLLFGRGITDAERMRDQISESPRVIIDPRALREVERNRDLRAHGVMEELGYIRSLLRQDADGLWFVDYLWSYRSEVERPFYLDFVKEHCDLVSRKLESLSTLDSSSRAVTWLWSYHERVYEDVKNNFRLDADELAELRLPASSPLVYRFPPSAKAP